MGPLDPLISAQVRADKDASNLANSSQFAFMLTAAISCAPMGFGTP